MLVGAVILCGDTVVTVVIGWKVGGTFNGTAFMRFKKHFSKILVEFKRETSNGGGAIVVFPSPDVTAGMLRLSPAAHDSC